MCEHTYIRVRWLHSSQEEPVDLWSELNQKRYETRKLEIWRNGFVGYASADEASRGTRLGEVPVPTLAEIVANSEFEAEEIPRIEFEIRWATRLSG